MMSALQRNILVQAGWLAGMAALVCGAVVGTDALIRSRGELLRERLQLIESREPSDDDAGRPGAAAQSLAALQAGLESAQAVVEDESLRVVALSRAAQSAGVTLVAIRSPERSDGEDGPILRREHDVDVRGGYRQLAEFLDGLQSAEGLVAIDQLQIEPGDPSAGAPLRASLRVTWFGPGPVPASALPEAEGS